LHLLTDDRLQIAVADFPFAVGQLLEAGKGIIEILALQAVTKLLQAGAEGAAARELAEGDAVIGQANRAGVDDLVGEAILSTPSWWMPDSWAKALAPTIALLGCTAMPVRFDTRREVL
jgi:hypothetical protein